MKLVEAVKRANAPSSAGIAEFQVHLLTGFEALHLKTFLKAWLLELRSPRRIVMKTGIFGDLAGGLASALAVPGDGIALVIEWPDLDPRLGVRSLGGWQLGQVDEIVRETERRTLHYVELIKAASGNIPIVVSLPSIPLLPAFSPSGTQAGGQELELERILATFGAELGSISRVKVLNSRRLDRLSEPTTRHDLRSEISTGFPYQLTHADVLAAMLAENLRPSPRRKGLITDLDDTLWRGILGEDGADGVSWDLDHKTQMHGLYQQFLASLADIGILIGVATKNSPEIVERVLNRPDLHIGKDQIFPIKANWGPKSESIREILQAWNIVAQDVVFIDDSPMELAQVAQSIPGITCLHFPTRDEKSILDLLESLRDQFGKDSIHTEDILRAASLKQGQAWNADAAEAADPESFLKRAEAEILFDFSAGRTDRRALELINKTNQFNINGKRWAEAEWESFHARKGTVLITLAYTDKYGPLGKIGALLADRKSVV